MDGSTGSPEYNIPVVDSPVEVRLDQDAPVGTDDVSDQKSKTP
ncbi:MAG TPA: hypothetical protein VIM11_11405 [Tepidisphaeraceae bacterium]